MSLRCTIHARYQCHHLVSSLKPVTARDWGACVLTSPRSSTQRLTKDIVHLYLVMEGSHVKVGPRHTPGSWSVFEVTTLSPMLEIDIGPRQ